MKRFSELMDEQTLLPIIQANTVEQGINTARAMYQAGLGLVEVVLRTDVSLDLIKQIKSEIPELIVGAGTVIKTQTIEQALFAGADFIVTPAVSSGLLKELKTCGVPALPGVSNTGDIMLAYESGFTEQKLFPASLSGGVAFLSSLQSVFQTITFCLLHKAPWY